MKPNNQGTLMKIVEDKKATIVVEFQDKHKYRVETIYMNFKNGQIKNPYDKTHCDVGFVGRGEYKTTLENGKHPQSYIIWNAVIERCYKTSLKNKFPSYYGICTVCNEWHNYQNFAKWFDENYYTIGEGRMHIDKDILVQGNTVYSPEKCLIVPQRINMLFVFHPNKTGLPSGIGRSKNGYTASYNTKRLGTFKTLEDAYSVYANQKENEIKKIANEYKNAIPQKLYATLMNYKVLLENDKNYIAS